MNAKRLIALAASVPAVIFLAVAVAGCSGGQVIRTSPMFGSVVAPEATPLRGTPKARDIVVDLGGKSTRLNDVYDDATILVFTNDACSDANARILHASAWLDPNVALIEVASNPASCQARQDCIAAQPRGKVGNVVSLCDGAGLLQAMYKVNGEGTILVLDEDGFVRNYGKLADYDYLRLAAEDLARRAVRDREERLHGDGGRDFR